MHKINFNKDWDFNLAAKLPAGTDQMKAGAWKRIDLPHDFSIDQDTYPDCRSGASGGYYPGGLGWYVKHFDVPEEWREKKLYIEFEGVSVKTITSKPKGGYT
jgi:beta-galactosidase